ncbi:unnamed protein product [Cyclocybe aegerita]|uniref:Uncharacterized protein n=1 Tax=Cyclocybe aegerita TaxID=1973307 RepID=A0A8S0X0D8_CYCAE|nr:unnamed protein product [Cyclocybe aegerita]
MAQQPSDTDNSLWNGVFVTPSTSELPSAASSTSNTDEKMDPVVAVLQNVDLLTIVFNHMPVDRSASDQDVLQARKDLLAAVLVCQTFTEPALDALWRVLPSLTPLLKLLPSFGQQDGTYVIEDIREDDWSRYNVHARRVRVLDLRPSQIPISRFAYPIIVQERQGPLLPCLRELRIPDNASIDLTLAMILSTPELRVVELHNSAIRDTQFFYPFLASIGRKHTNLRSLILEGDRIVNLKPVLTLAHLRKLELRLANVHLSPTFMEELGSMTALRDLAIHAGVAVPNVVPQPIRRECHTRVEDLDIDPAYSKFRQLERLHVLGSLPCITHIVKYMRLASLKSFVLTEIQDSSGVSSQQFWIKCFRHLTRFSSLITTIKINCAAQQRRDESRAHTVLEPLLELKMLTSLDVNGLLFNVMTELDISNIACAFPHLKNLVLPSGSYRSAPPLQSLCYFALECPRLEEVSLFPSYDQDIDKMLEGMAKEADRLTRDHDHPLRKLFIGSSAPLSNTQSVKFAHILDRLFPNLEVLQRYMNQTSTDWSLVRDIQATIQMVRRSCS